MRTKQRRLLRSDVQAAYRRGRTVAGNALGQRGLDDRKKRCLVLDADAFLYRHSAFRGEVRQARFATEVDEHDEE